MPYLPQPNRGPFIGVHCLALLIPALVSCSDLTASVAMADAATGSHSGDAGNQGPNPDPLISASTPPDGAAEPSQAASPSANPTSHPTGSSTPSEAISSLPEPNSTASASDDADSGGGSGSIPATDTGAPAPGTPGSLNAGNPDGACTSSLPLRAIAVAITNPTSVVGTGSAESCTFDALSRATDTGGVITFDCGPSPVTIDVTATLNLPTDRDTLIDGGALITLDGGSAVQILRFDSPNFQANDHSLTLQHITLARGKMTPTEVIPLAPAPCSQGYNDGEGGALFMRDGNLNLIDTVFAENQAAPLGPDTGGGAIYVLGSKHGVVIADSTFDGNYASNAGAVGSLFAELNIFNSLFINNQAVGHDANGNEPDKCDAMNNGQNETGSGGNGGAIYSDGGSVNVFLCGDKIVGNSAGSNAYGGGLFFTSNDFGGTLTIADTVMADNSGGSWTNVSEGEMNNAGSAVGTNTKSLSIVNSVLQGL